MSSEKDLVKKLLVERIRNLKKSDTDADIDKYYKGWNEGLDEAIEIVKASSEV